MQWKFLIHDHSVVWLEIHHSVRLHTVKCHLMLSERTRKQSYSQNNYFGPKFVKQALILISELKTAAHHLVAKLDNKSLS